MVGEIFTVLGGISTSLAGLSARFVAVLDATGELSSDTCLLILFCILGFANPERFSPKALPELRSVRLRRPSCACAIGRRCAIGGEAQTWLSAVGNDQKRF